MIIDPSNDPYFEQNKEYYKYAELLISYLNKNNIKYFISGKLALIMYYEKNNRPLQDIDILVVLDKSTDKLNDFFSPINYYDSQWRLSPTLCSYIHSWKVRTILPIRRLDSFLLENTFGYKKYNCEYFFGDMGWLSSSGDWNEKYVTKTKNNIYIIKPEALFHLKDNVCDFKTGERPRKKDVEDIKFYEIKI